MAKEKEEGTSLGGHPLSEQTDSKEDEQKQSGIEFEGHSFSTVDELVESYRKLEKAYGQQSNRVGELKKLATSPEPRNVEPPKPEMADERIDFRELGDLLIEDTEKGAKKLSEVIQNQVTRQISQMSEAQKRKEMESSNEEKTWDAFFEKNPWLSHRRAEVQATAYNVLYDDLKSRETVEAQFDFMADYFRDATERSADLLNGRDASTKKSISPRSGQSGVSGTSEETPAKKKTFADAIRDRSHVPKL